MKKFLLPVICLPLALHQICHAQKNQHSKLDGLGFINFAGAYIDYDYNDFKFNSTNGTNYKRYNGHINSIRLGGSVFILGAKSSPSPAFGQLSIAQRFSNISGDALIAPAARVQTSSSVRTTALDLEIKKPITKHVLFGVGGQYSYGRVYNDYTRGGSQTGASRGIVHNLSGALSLVGMNQVGYFKVMGDISLLEVRTVTPGLSITWANPAQTQLVNKVSRSSTWTNERLRISYHAKPNFIPYLSAGLIQNLVAPNVTLTTITSNLPQLNVFESGYSVGGGATIKFRKHTRLIASYNYSNLGNGLFKNHKANVTLAYGL